MVIQTFLYICRGCGKQKKPTDQFCETCMKNGKQANASNTAPAIMLTRFRSLRIVEGSLVKSNGIGVSPSTSSPLQNGSYVVLGRNMETLEEVRLELTQRQSGLYVPGVAGAGKSTMLNNIITTDATNGHGIFVFDVQGDLTEDVLARLPAHRLSDVIVLEPGENNNPFGINLLAHSAYGVDHDVDVCMSVVKQVAGVGTEHVYYGPRLATLLRNGLYTLWYNELTLAELPILLRSKEFRTACLKNIPESGRWVKFFWERDFDKLSNYLQQEKSESTLNKIYGLLTIREVEYVISQKKTTVDFRHIMDESKICILKLPKHTIGTDAVEFLATVVFTSLLETARSRSDVSIDARPFFSCIIDEFGSVTNPLFPEMFAELRKLNLSFTIAHQFLSQLDEENRGATQQLTNQAVFRIRAKDAEALAPYHAKQPTVEYKEQEKKTPDPRVADKLISGLYSHEPQVKEFFALYTDTYRMAQGRIRDLGEVPTVSRQWARFPGHMVTVHGTRRILTSQSEVDVAFDDLTELNRFFHSVMSEKNPYQVFPPKLWYLAICAYAASHDGYLQDNPVSRHYFSLLADLVRKVVLKQVDTSLLTVYQQFWLARDEQALQEAFLAYEHAFRLMLSEHLRSHCTNGLKGVRLGVSFYNDFPSHAHGSAWYNQQVQKDYLYELSRALPSPLQAERIIAALPMEKVTFRIKPVSSNFEVWYLEDFPQTSLNPLIQAEVDSIVSRDKDNFEQFIRDIRAVCQALATTPKLTQSGEYEMVEVSRRLVQDMVNDMALELTSLPNHVCYVKRGAKGEESKKIQTLPLPPGCSASDLETRKQIIAQNTLPYTTSREDVEQELQKRHLDFLNGGSLQRQEQVPITEEPQAETKEIAAASPGSQPGQGQKKQTPAAPAPSSSPHAVGTTTDYLELLYYFSNLTLIQAMKLVGYIGETKDEQLKMNKREQSRINKLIGSGLVETVDKEATAFLKTGGRIPLVYRLSSKGYDKLHKEKGLKPINQGDFSPHSYKVNEVVISLLRGIKETSCTLVDFMHEKQFRQKAIALGDKGLEPDAWLCLRKDGKLHSIFVEVDLKNEGSSKLKDKVRRYLQAIEKQAHKGFTAENTTIVFVTPNGKDADTDRLVRIIEETIEQKDAAYFLVGSVTLEDIQPLELVTGSLFKRPFDSALYPLIQLHDGAIA